MDSRLSQLQKELTEVQIARGEGEAIFNAIREIESRGGSYDAVPQVANDPIIQDLKEQAYSLEQEVEELSSSYREGHPKIGAAKAALADIPRKIEAETEKIISRIKTEYAESTLHHPLGLGGVLHAQYIRDTLDTAFRKDSSKTRQ